MFKKRMLGSLLSIGLMYAATFSYAVIYSPYFDATLGASGDGPGDIKKIADAAKIKAISLAFIQAPITTDPKTRKTVAGPGISWGGMYSVGNGWGASEIQALSAIGPVTISFGGASAGNISNGYVAENYDAATTLAAVYQTVFDTYKCVKRFDWDIEGDRIEGLAASNPIFLKKMAEAIATFQQKNKIFVSFTLRAMPSGVSANVIKIVKAMQTAKVDIGCINIMAMDYGTDMQDMGKAATDAAIKTATQLGLPLSKIGITPMIGINDTTKDNPKEIFTLQDAVTVYNFANAKNISFIGCWSLNRDHGGITPASKEQSDKNCGLWIADYAFASAFQTGKYPPAPPQPPPADVSVAVNAPHGVWIDTKEFWIDGKSAGNMDNNHTFKVPHGTHVLGLMVGSEKDVKCPQYNFEKDKPVTVKITGYKWGSGNFAADQISFTDSSGGEL